MKWTIQELRKLSRTQNNFHSTCDCKKYINEDEMDILDVSLVDVLGKFQVMERQELYVFELEITCELTMPCAITLEEVLVPLHFHTTLEFAKAFIDDNTHIIEGMTIDLEPYIWAEILVEKPMKVLSEHAYDSYVEELVHLDEDEINPSPFKTLKD